jgi:hypothetical protein
MDRNFKYYDILNSIKPKYYQDKDPYTVLTDNNISLTYKDIYLNYIKDQRFLVDSEKPKKIKGGFNKAHTMVFLI